MGVAEAMVSNSSSIFTHLAVAQTLTVVMWPFVWHGPCCARKNMCVSQFLGPPFQGFSSKWVRPDPGRMAYALALKAMWCALFELVPYLGCYNRNLKEPPRGGAYVPTDKTLCSSLAYQSLWLCQEIEKAQWSMQAVTAGQASPCISRG